MTCHWGNGELHVWGCNGPLWLHLSVTESPSTDSPLGLGKALVYLLFSVHASHRHSHFAIVSCVGFVSHSDFSAL